MTTTTTLPGLDVPSAATAEERKFYDAVKESLEVIAGSRSAASPELRGVTVDDLVRAGLVRATIKGGYAYLSSGPAVVGSGAGGSRSSTPRDASGIPLWLDLSRTSVALISYANGSVPSFAAATGQATVYYGSLNVTDGSVLSYDQSTGITGTLNTAANTPVLGQPKGYYEVTALDTDWGELTIRASYGSLTMSRKFVVTRVSAGVEIVDVLPTTNNFEGRIVFLTTDGKLYIYTAGAWGTAVPAASGIESVSSLPVTASEGDVVFLTTDGKLYRRHSGAWTAAVPATDISGTLADAQIAALAASKITGTLTDAQLAAIASTKITGQLTDAQLAAIASTKITGQLTDAQIAGFSTSKLTGQITSTQITDNSVTTAKIAANAVTATQISAGAIRSDKLLVQGRGAALNHDPSCVDQSVWVAGAGTVTANTANSSAPGGTALRATAGSGSYAQPGSLAFPVSPGKRYRLSLWAQQISGSGVVYARIYTLNTAGSLVAYDVGLEGFSITGAMAQYTGSLLMPSNAATASVQLWSSYSAGGGAVDFADIRVEEVLPGTLIQDGVITTAKLAAGAVTAATIAANTITAAQIAAATITATQIAAATITGDRLVAGTITASQIAAATITATQIAANTITAAKIAAGTITATEIAAATITGDRLVANTITASQIAAATITGDRLVAGTITASQIAAATITANELASDSVTANKILTGTITAAKLAAATITAASGVLADAVITSAKIADGAILNAKIGNLEVDSAKIANLTVGTTKITDNAVSTSTGAYTAALTSNIPPETPTVIQSVTLTCSGAPVALFAQATLWQNVAFFANLQVARDGTVLSYSEAEMPAGGGAVSALALDTPSAGSHTYTLMALTDASNVGGFYARYRTLIAIELKK